MSGIRPSRPPDLTIDYISFWWAEKIQSNDYTVSSEYFNVDVDKWRYQRINSIDRYCMRYGIWIEYKGWSLFDDNEKRIKDSYAKWAMEREFFGVYS